MRSPVHSPQSSRLTSNPSTTTILDSAPPTNDVQELFNRIAPVYDQFNHWLSLGQHQVWKQMTVRWSRPFLGATCLDVCCGSGDLTRLLAQAVGTTGHVTGLDFAAAQLERAKQITAVKVGDKPISWVEGDALNLPFEDNSFDAVTMGYGLRNVVDIQGALRELLRVLKPRCTVAILDFHRPYNSTMHGFQTWCLNQVVVPLASQFGLAAEYAYILPSLERFPQGFQQVQIAQATGFVNVVHYEIVGGMMGVLVAQKSNF
ncbi:MAG: bifunctional demethylmenaquinone methyltransferase/2-methoxy-6-polyprenyl-1,4-benzoquinol methylase UbiE [Cyanothece sp. SIO2G6]|nr:bifunctional demethylmenaquinone methyltransferase/2-methoxy-6-polyprenyl-1,4-benzoquinol methylase UbiE [Cyanothece sp. SIO2G6]